jgi:hypothetical protein
MRSAGTAEPVLDATHHHVADHRVGDNRANAMHITSTFQQMDSILFLRN